MAEVWLAREPLAGGLAKILVIKKIHPSLAEAPRFRQMFEDEAKIAVNLNHPNIVQTFGYGLIGPTYYLAMEHVEGVDLLRLLNAATEAKLRIPMGLCAYLGQQIAKGLDYAHRKTDEYGQALGIVHRDISPQNVLVTWDGSVKIVDFGIARAVHVREDEGVVKGKFAYMSPEQASGAPVDARSDIFSTGVVLWELVCQRSLFGRLKGRQALNAVKNAQVSPPREVDETVPEELSAIIVRALSLKADDRFQTARDLHRALGKFFFELSAREGVIYESGNLAALMAQVVPPALRVPAMPPPEAQPAKSAAGGAAASQSGASSAASAGSASGAGPSQASLPSVERKHVVVIESELSGLAGLRRHLGEARSREALLDFLRVCEHVAYKHGAHPDRLDERGFTYLLGLPVATEDDPSRAIRFAAALIEALEGISRELDPPLKLAIGVQRGEALLTRPTPGVVAPKLEYELLGHTAEIARRLSKEAMPGEVLAGGGVYRSARAEWRFEELEPIDLPETDTPPGDDVDDEGGAAASAEKLPPRARVYRLLGPRPRAERLADEPKQRLVGRDLELAALKDAHRSVVELNQARHLLLLGEAGVGKRAIVDAFRRTLDPATHIVLRAAARPSLRETPYALSADLSRDLLGVSEETDAREVRRRLDAAVALLFRPEEAQAAQKVADALALLLGAKVPGTEELDPGERRHRLYVATRTLAERLAASRTLVVVIEDLHWADQQSFDILNALAKDRLARPLLAIATARHEERIDELARQPETTPIVVGELGPREREELIVSQFESPADAAALAHKILDRAGGNPFYVSEILESLVERGILAPAPAPEGATGPRRLRWVKRDEEIAVPTTVEAVVGSRLDKLPDDERDVIRRAALLGRVFRVEDLVALGDRDPVPGLARLAGRGLIAPASAPADQYQGAPAAYAFRNLITKEVAYGGLASPTRALLHSIAADRLVHAVSYRPGADDARLAEHLEGAGEHLAAARALIAAGLYARDSASNSDAFKLFSRALALLPPKAHAERYQAHAEREQILRSWGKRPAQLREVNAMRKAAAALGDARRQAEAASRLGLYYLETGKHAAARRELRGALKLAREAKDALGESEALRLEALLLTNIGKNAEAAQMARKALAAVDTNTTDRAHLLARGQALNVVGNVHVHTGHLREAVSAYAEALVIYRRLGARRLEAQALSQMGWVFVGLGEYEEALGHYKRSLKLTQDLGDRAGVGMKLANIGQTYGDLGDLARAHRYLDKALELHQALADQPGAADALISRAQLSLRERAFPEAARDLERGLELASKTRNRYQEIRALVYLAFCKLERGESPEAALELAQSATRLARESRIANGEAYGLAAEARALEQMGKPVEALERSKAAVALVDSGRDVDSPEEILYVHARAARAKGAHEAERAALRRACAQIMRKARLLHDPAWRARYLAASPAQEILAAARAAGIEQATAETA